MPQRSILLMERFNETLLCLLFLSSFLLLAFFLLTFLPQRSSWVNQSAGTWENNTKSETTYGDNRCFARAFFPFFLICFSQAWHSIGMAKVLKKWEQKGDRTIQK